MKRWWNSTTTTIAATVVAAIVLGFSLQHVVSTGLFRLGLARQQTIEKVNSSLLLQLPGRVTTLLDVLEATPHAERAAVIAAAQRPQVRVRLLDAPMPNLSNRDEPDADLLRHRIEATLTAPRSVVVAEWYRTPDQQVGPGVSRIRIGVLIETSLSDGHWLFFWCSLLPPPVVDPIATQFSRASFVAWLVISVLLGILLSILAARRMVRPLSELATAVEQIGGKGDVPPISPRGTREVHGVILAFNRMRERLRRFNEDRTRMLAAMSHDLRMPLTRLRLRAELVEDQVQQEKMLAELDMMGDMIESMLSFAMDDARREPRSLVDLSALVEGVCQDASDAGEPVTFSGPRGITISCRPAVMRRAVSNLVDNAVKYGGSAAVSLVPEAERVVIIIDDEGPGIPWGEREKVFQPFYRIERSRDPDLGGVGLGLSVARSILWEHGGDISLANRKGGGLTVRLELPSTTTSSAPDQQEIRSINQTGTAELHAVRNFVRPASHG